MGDMGPSITTKLMAAWVTTYESCATQVPYAALGVYTSEETLLPLLVTVHCLYNLMEGPQEPCEFGELAEPSPSNHKGMPGGNSNTSHARLGVPLIVT